MSDIQMVVFKLNDEEYGIEINQVQEIVRMMNITNIPNAPIFVEGIVNLRGSIVPIIDLKKRFYGTKTENTEHTRIIVVKVETKTFGLITDEVAEVIQLSHENIDAPPELLSLSAQNGIRAVGKLKNRLIVILDVNKFLSNTEFSSLDTLN